MTLRRLPNTFSTGEGLRNPAEGLTTFIVGGAPAVDVGAVLARFPLRWAPFAQVNGAFSADVGATCTGEAAEHDGDLSVRR